ncbi:SDR family oxidoreductase [Pseudomonas luteola]|uniref:SDR family oxidoreductase n=1 Tax=Pseudomonas luteola TaxID=47886 RepID=UPI001239E3FB|nr:MULTISPECIES: SDR family oxidoreductase [Pseudomonas]MBA1249687.1 SDR family NAD(P)-dependent oxidoreductase [Pseudomonas zeshuii]QEU31121.1 SDR family NAD(P)-dependent oxidoreductase [Pseudomonas luteola]
MKPVPKPLHQQTIVITGATSGIGLATARMAAQKGAKLVLVSRDEAALQSLQHELSQQWGAQAIHVAADVGNRADLEQVAKRAVERFDGFDTWVNNAGTLVWGRLWEVSEADLKKVFETNFWGVVNGSLVAVEHFRQREGGTLINLGSALSEAVAPLQGIYTASKHAVKAFTDALRIELRHDNVPVAVTLIRPSSTNTPINDRAKNYLAHTPHLPAPTYVPETVARAILRAAERPKRDVYIGNSKLITRAAQLTPRLFDWLAIKTLFAAQQSKTADAFPSDALYEPVTSGSTRGRNPGPMFRHSLYAQASQQPAKTAALAGAVGLALYSGWRLIRACKAE